MSVMKHTKDRKAWMSELHILVAKSLPNLKQLKHQGHQASFNELMEELLPGVKRYISRRLRVAVCNGHIPAGKYKVDDFVDELFIQAYDHIQEVKSGKDLHGWLFKKADEMLEDTAIEEDFDDTFFENIDDYGKEEWGAMEENLSTDGDGDLVMEEELDDYSYPKFDYTLKDVFVENNEESLIEKLDRELSQEEISRHIDMVLHRLPLLTQSVFELSVNQQFPIDEIAEIKRISVSQAEQHLVEARRFIRLSMERRYSVVEN